MSAPNYGLMYNRNVAVLLENPRAAMEHAGEKQQKEDRMSLKFSW